MKIARELTLPIKRRTFENHDILNLFGEDMHCFEISAISKSIHEAMDEENVWPDVASILPFAFLPSPVTWLESTYTQSATTARIATVLVRDETWWTAYIVIDGKSLFGMEVASFRPCSILQNYDRIEMKLSERWSSEAKDYNKQMTAPIGADMRTYDAAALTAHIDTLTMQREAVSKDAELLEEKLDTLGAANRFIGAAILALDLINTPGLVGFRQHAPHAGLARRLGRGNVGRYPLRGWSEVVVKTHTSFDHGDYESGATFRKCLHFVRSHQRRYQDGHVTVIPAHWRGDPALGIKRTRYRVTA